MSHVERGGLVRFIGDSCRAEVSTLAVAVMKTATVAAVIRSAAAAVAAAVVEAAAVAGALRWRLDA